MRAILAIFFIVFLFSCQKEKNKTAYNTHSIKVVEAKGYVVPKDSMGQPKVILVDESKLKKIPVGNPEVVPTNLNIHTAGIPTVIKAGIPRVCIPGTDTFLLPKTIPAIVKVTPAGMPEVVIAKDAASKDQNPANFSFYKTLQGLKHHTIRCMLQDKTGNLWFGTYGGGVARYDGKSFTNFTDKEGLANNYVYSILEDKAGNLWFGTDGGGVSRYDGKSFTNFTDKEGLPNNFVFSILEDKTGNLWFGTYGGGVSRYDGNRVEEIESRMKSGETISDRDQHGLKKENGKLVKSFTNYTDKEGLANNVVVSILEDKTGNLWFGTYGGGVSRYDGNRVEEIEARVKRGETISERDQQGLRKDNGKLVKSFTNFTDKEGLASNVVLSILEDKTGNLWFGTYGGGVSRYDGNRVEEIEARIKRGETISERDQQGLNKENGKLVKSFTNFTDKEGLSKNSVWIILEDKTGNLWFGTSGGGLSRYDGNRVEEIEARIKRGETISERDQQGLNKENGKLVKSFTNFTDKEGLSNNSVWSILEDKTGNLWFGTNGGVCRYDGKSFTNFTDKEGLANNAVLSILEDKAGNLWFGTFGGVCRYDGKSFTNFTDKEGLANNYVYSILEDKAGNLWFGTNGGGVSRYDGKSFTNFTVKEGLANNVVWSMIEDQTGNLWFGTDGGGVSRYDGNRVEEIEARIKRGETISERDQQGLRKVNGKLVKSFTNFTDKEGLPNNVVFSILEDQTGNLWFGTYGGGVSRYDGNRVEEIESRIKRGETISERDQHGLKKENGKLVKSFTNYTDKEGLANNVVWSILEDKTGNLWFGTNGGVCRYDGNYFTNFTDKEGLANNAVLNLLQDKEGNIWFGTRKGLSRLQASHIGKLVSLNFDKDNSFDPIKEGLFYNYGYNDGFLGLNCKRNSVLQDSKGNIWWGTDVLICYNPKGEEIDASAPVVQLKSVELFGENMAWANLGAVSYDSTEKEIVNGKIRDTLLGNGVLLKDIHFDGITKWYNLPEHLSLPYNNNNLTFSFIGIHMQSRNHIKYQYKLEGLEENWSSITERTEAPYGNLPPGEYTFKVKAMNQSGVWSEPFEFKFEVRPPWWQTWWFRTIVVVLVVASIWYYIRSREKKLLAEKAKLEKTVAERTEELVQKNIVVEQQKHLVEEKHKEITDSINYAERIQRSLLASKKMLDENLTSTGSVSRDYFILFKPKDVVSGDFYWASCVKTSDAKGQNFLLCVADSTGHGVPGAIMSILNISCLEKAVEVENLISPNEILNHTRTKIIETLKKDGSVEGGKDGMDGSLLSFDFKKNKLQCASANNPVWIIRNNELIEIKANRYPIGKHERDNEPFTLHTLDLQKGDVVYLLTDGFPDQFGGPAGKKFKYKQLQELLLSIAHEPMSAQKQKLNDIFENWKGDLEQVDDVTIVGVKM